MGRLESAERNGHVELGNLAKFGTAVAVDAARQIAGNGCNRLAAEPGKLFRNTRFETTLKASSKQAVDQK
jgi:hypothetical protein